MRAAASERSTAGQNSSLHSQLVLLQELLAGREGLGQRAAPSAAHSHDLPGLSRPPGERCKPPRHGRPDAMGCWG